MINYSSILFITDFSAASRLALQYAIKNLLSPESRLILLHAYAGTLPTSAPMISLQDLLRMRSEEGLRAEYEHVRQNFDCSTIDIVQRSKSSSILEAVQEIIPEEKADLIVLAKSQFQTIQLEMVQNINSPILLIPT